MKTLLLFLAIGIALSLHAEDIRVDPLAPKVRITGYVLQRLETGALVACRPTDRIGAKKADGIVFLHNYAQPDDSKVNLRAVLVGTYKYTTVQGALKIADAYVVAP